MSKGTVYIAGPMRGIPLYNFPAFDEAKAKLEAEGYTVISPADLDRESGFHETDTLEAEDRDAFMRQAMKRDMNAICRCSHIALLPNWDQSKGCRPEIVLAYTLGLAFLYAPTAAPIDGGAVVAVIGSNLWSGGAF